MQILRLWRICNNDNHLNILLIDIFNQLQEKNKIINICKKFFGKIFINNKVSTKHNICEVCKRNLLMKNNRIVKNYIKNNITFSSMEPIDCQTKNHIYSLSLIHSLLVLLLLDLLISKLLWN